MRQIVINISPFLVQSALVEDGRLLELIIDSPLRVSLAGNIYAATVSDVQKNGFAFLKIDEGKKGLLQLDDYRQKGLAKVSAGQKLIVQVIRDESGDKGPMLSAALSFAGRFLILVKNPDDETYVRLSGKITDDVLRGELKSRIQSMVPEGFGVILRTAAARASDEEIGLEIENLHTEAKKVLETGVLIKPPALLHGGEKIYSQSLKGLLDTEPERIMLDSCDELSYVKNCALKYTGLDAVALHTGELGIFEAYGIAAQADRALNHKTWLDCGGYLLIEEAEAAVFIDVNTGKFQGRKNFADSAMKVNTEAAWEIAAQIRLKDLSGLIIVDFINSRSTAHAEQLKEFFLLALKNDRNPAVIIDWSDLNIVQLTRKRTRPPLREALLTPCSCCSGRGAIPGPVNLADKAYKEIIKIYKGGFYDRIKVNAHKDIAVLLQKADFPVLTTVGVSAGKPAGFYEIVPQKL